MTRYFFYLLFFCLTACSAFAQRADSLKADSSKKGPAIKLNTVTVRGQRPVIERRPDGIVFNVTSLSVVAGADGADILRKIPMVSVSGSGQLAVRGSANVKVLIDGKPSEVYASTVADALRILRGEQIVKVEVITDPSSRYDAEGTDAVINIITRKLKDRATNANIGGTAGNRAESLVGDLHRQQGAWQLHGDLFYQHYWNKNGSVLQRESAGLSLRQENETRQVGNYISGGFSLLYSLDSLNTLNAGYRVRKFPNTVNSIANNYDMNNGVPAFLFSRTMETPSRNGGDSYTIGFNGQSKNKKSEYALLGLYAPGESMNNYTLQQVDKNSNLYDESFFGKIHNKDLMIQADYTHSFVTDLKWDAGAKFTDRSARSNSQYQPDSGRSATFSYQTRIYAAYANISFRLGKWGFSGGLRYERTGLSATFKNTTAAIPSFDNLVPQALIQYNVNDKTSLKLSYARKLVRPQVSYLDPTVITNDPLTVQYGNPTLQPELVNRYQLNYSVNDIILFSDLVLFFNDNRNTIENIRLPISNGRFASTWQNVGKNRRLGLSATLNWKPGKIFTLGTTLTAQYVRLESGTLNISNSALTQQLVINASYKLPKGYSLDFYGFFAGNSPGLQGYRSGWKFYNMTLNKKFKNERLTMSLRSEVFLTPYSYIDEVIESSSYTQRLSYRYQNQSVRLTLSYKIGKKEIKSPQVSTIDP
jgi:outer membrane receptor for ferrienterochelin and colicin